MNVNLIEELRARAETAVYLLDRHMFLIAAQELEDIKKDIERGNLFYVKNSEVVYED